MGTAVAGELRTSSPAVAKARGGIPWGDSPKMPAPIPFHLPPNPLAAATPPPRVTSGANGGAVGIPAGANGPANPTGQIFNSTIDFLITTSIGTAPAQLILAGEGGTIVAWARSVSGDTASIAYDDAAAGADRMIALAGHPNVYVKVSALPCFSTAPYPFDNLREPLRRVIAAFGPRRSFWGSDITRVPATCSYRQVVTHFTEELDFLSADDLEWIMGRGLAECLGCPV